MTFSFSAIKLAKGIAESSVTFETPSSIVNPDTVAMLWMNAMCLQCVVVSALFLEHIGEEVSDVDCGVERVY